MAASESRLVPGEWGWPSLEELGLAYTRGRGEGLTALGRALDRSALPKLKEISYDGNPCPAEAKRDFAEALVNEAKRKKRSAQEKRGSDGTQPDFLEERTLAYMRNVRATNDPHQLGHTIPRDGDLI